MTDAQSSNDAISLRAAALAAGGVLLTSRIAFAGSGTRPRFVFIILRGALDGLTRRAAVRRIRDYARLRGEVAIAAPGSSRRRAQARRPFRSASRASPFCTSAMARRSSSCFTPSPALIVSARTLMARTCSRTAARGRMRCRPAGSIARLPRCRPSAARGAGELGIALGQNVPLVMRGPAPVASWSPSHLAALDEDTLQRITDLYSTDPLLVAAAGRCACHPDGRGCGTGCGDDRRCSRSIAPAQLLASSRAAQGAAAALPIRR